MKFALKAKTSRNMGPFALEAAGRADFAGKNKNSWAVAAFSQTITIGAIIMLFAKLLSFKRRKR